MCICFILSLFGHYLCKIYKSSLESYPGIGTTRPFLVMKGMSFAKTSPPFTVIHTYCRQGASEQQNCLIIKNGQKQRNTNTKATISSTTQRTWLILVRNDRARSLEIKMPLIFFFHLPFILIPWKDSAHDLFSEQQALSPAAMAVHPVLSCLA